MTLKSLEKWLAEYIINVYHKQIHSGINCTPEHKYEIGIFGDGKTSLGRGLPERIADEDKFKISLLPTIERTIQQSGIKIDSIQYYADALRRWIRAKDKDKKARKFIFKRDLRDISTIWFYDPEIKEYYPIPFRNISYPPISVWDLRAIKKYLDDNNVTGYDEVTIFSAYEKMKQIKGDMPDLVLRALCKKRGIDISKIDITYTQTPPEAAGLFLQRDYDILIVPQPLPAATILRGKKMGIAVHYGVDIPKVWGESFNTKPYIPMAGIIVDVDFYKENLPLFDTLHSDLTNALSWIKDNKQSAAKIGAEYLPAPEPALVNAFDRANLTVIKARDMQDEIMLFFETIFEFNPKLLGGKMPDKSLFL